MTLKEFADRCGPDMLPATITQTRFYHTEEIIVRLRHLANYGCHQGLGKREINFFTIARTEKGLCWYISLE